MAGLDIAAVRARLASTELEAARAFMPKLIRRAATHTIYAYAQRNHIVDFADADLTLKRHRDYREQIVTLATNAAADVQVASDIDDLLAVFDSIAAYLDG